MSRLRLPIFLRLICVSQRPPSRAPLLIFNLQGGGDLVTNLSKGRHRCAVVFALTVALPGRRYGAVLAGTLKKNYG
jgi:hypothetical protein